MMSENPLLHTATADKLSALKSRFIQRDRFEDLAKEFYESLSARLADLRAERVDEVQNISQVGWVGPFERDGAKLKAQQGKLVHLESGQVSSA